MSADRPRTELTAAGLAAPDRELAPRLAAPDRELTARPAAPDRELTAVNGTPGRALASLTSPARPIRRGLAAGTRPAAVRAAPPENPAAPFASRGTATLLGVAVNPGARPSPVERRPDPPATRGPAVPHETDLELDAIDPATTVELTADELAAIVAEATAIPAAGPARTARTSLELAAAWYAPRATAPGPTASAAPIRGSEGSPAPALPAFPHGCRPPRLRLVVLYLLGSLCCGLFAPFCWSVASSELGGIRRGTVEDRHRGLLAIARLWGAVASGLLIAGFLLALSVLARSAIHP